MFSQVLDCPKCGDRFHYEHGDNFPPKITCPSCQQSSPAKEFFAVTFCPECRSKLKVPLSILNNSNNVCPHCRTRLVPENDLSDEETLTDQEKSSRNTKRMLNDGDLFDKYRIIKLLGKGGMAEVYLAEHLLLKQQCALKLMQKSMETDDQIFAKRFIREAKLTHQFTHPNIVKVFDAGTDFKSGYLFLAMEYVEGKTLLDISRERQLTEMDLMSILSAMLDALQALCDARVVHRDIKPSNIMLRKDGVFKLMDLGIAKSDTRTAGEMTLTMERTTIGTPGYASPEQCRSAHTVDCRSDIYSLGATLYHIASGTIPFDGETPVEIILKVMQQEPEPLRNLRPDLSHNFLSLIEKMMAKNPNDRPATPNDVLDILSGRKNDIFGRIKYKFLTISMKFLRERGLDKLDGIFFRPLINVGKVLWQVLEGGSSLLKALNLSAFSNWLCSLGLKLLRRAVILVILFFVILAVLYFFDTRRKDPTDPINFKSYVLSIFSDTRKSAKRPEAHKQQAAIPDPFVDKHPLMKYPDYSGEKNARNSWQSQSRQFQSSYPVIEFVSDNKWDIIADIDFHKNIPAGNFDRSRIKDKILHLDNAPACSLKLPRVVYETQFTFSADLFIPQQEYGVLLRTASVTFLLVRQELSVFFPGNYFIKTGVKFPPGKWINFAFAIDKEKRKISLFSGQCLLGAYLLPENSMQSFNEIFFSTEQNKHPFNGKIGRITVYSCARKYNFPSGETYRPLVFADTFTPPQTQAQQTAAAPLPQPVQEKKIEKTTEKPVQPAEENKTAQADTAAADAAPTVPQAAPAPAPAPAPAENQTAAAPEKPQAEPVVQLPAPRYYGGRRSIEIRLRESDERKNQILQLPESKIKVNALEYISRQQKELQNQLRIQLRVSTAARMTYNRTGTFKRAAENFLISFANKQNWSQQDHKKSESLLALLAGKVDPNLSLRYTSENNKLISLIDAVSRGLLRPTDKFIKRLIGKNVNVNNATVPLPLPFLFFGKNDVDEGYPQLIFSVANQTITQKLKNNYPSPELLYDEKTLCSFLLLSPKLNGLTDADGKNLMHYAAERDHADLARDLVLAGFTEGKNKDKQGLTPYQTALRRGNARVIKVLETYRLNTPFEDADKVQFNFCQHVKEGKTDAIADDLAAGANPYMVWHNELDTLQNVCLRGDLRMLECLLKNYVSPNKFNTSRPYGNPLQLAVLKGDVKMLELLLKYGASADDSKNFTSAPNLAVFILSRIRYEKYPEPVIALLSEVIKHDKNWDINRPVAGKSLLYHCLSSYTKYQYTRRKVVEFLLKNKANPDTKDIESIWLPADIKRLLNKSY